MRSLVAGRNMPGLALGMIAVVVAAAGGAYAASSTSTITVCIHHNGGGLYKAHKCAGHDKSLSWNAKGQAGPQGPQGAQGAQGAPGQQGQPGASAGANAIVRSADFVIGANTENGGVALCQSGERATGGGASPGGVTAGQIFPLESVPSDASGLVASSGQPPRGWKVIVYNGTASPVTSTVYAICVPA